MKDFIINLYANKYFPIYLGVVIIVLLIAFFIVFFLGKKDQKKIEETQKLNLEKLKDIQNNTVTTNNEVKTSVQSAPVVQTPAQPKAPVQPAVAPIVSTPEVKPVAVDGPIQTPVAPVNEVKTAPVVEPVKVTPVMEVKKDIVVAPPVKEVPPVIPPVMEIKPPIENTKPVIDDDVYRVNKKEEETVNRLKELSSSLDKEMKNLETKPLVTPEVQKEPTEKPKVMNVYSSVYVPNNNVVTPEKVETPVVENNDDFDDTMEIELPKLKTEEPILKDNSSDSLNLL